MRARSAARRPIVRAASVMAAGLLLAVAGCSEATEPAGNATATAAASDQPSLDEAAGLKEATAIVEKYRQPPVWQGPEESVDISGLAGKQVFYISVSNSIPVLKYWSDQVTAIVKKYADIDVTVIDAKGSVDEANKGFRQAIAQKADAIVVMALPPSLFKAQFEQAQAAGIKVITANSGIPGDVSSGQDAEVSFDYRKVGELIGAWMVADSKGKGKGLVISSDDVPASQPQVQGTVEEVARLCSACDVKVTDVQIPQWQSSIPTLFQTTINSDPERRYLLPLYDGQALPGLGAIRTAGAGDKVSVGAFNATPGIVEQLKDPKSGLKLEVGGHNEWWGYAAADQIFRVLSGAEPIENYYVGLRIFDQTNVDLIQGSDEFAWYESEDYKTKFPSLWKKG